MEVSLVKSIHWVETGDQRLMRRINRWRPPRWLRLWMIVATRGGDGWLWYALGTVVALFGGSERFLALGAAGVAVGLGVFLFLILKRTIGRKPPCAGEPPFLAALVPPDQVSFSSRPP